MRTLVLFFDFLKFVKNKNLIDILYKKNDKNNKKSLIITIDLWIT